MSIAKALARLKKTPVFFACRDACGDEHDLITVKVANVFAPPLAEPADADGRTRLADMEKLDVGLAEFYRLCNGCHLYTTKPLIGPGTPVLWPISNGVFFYPFETIPDTTAENRDYLRRFLGESARDLPYGLDDFWSIGRPCGAWVDIHLVHSGDAKGRLFWWVDSMMPEGPDETIADSFEQLLSCIANDPIFSLTQMFMCYSRYPSPKGGDQQLIPKRVKGWFR